MDNFNFILKADFIMGLTKTPPKMEVLCLKNKKIKKETTAHEFRGNEKYLQILV